MSRHPQAYQFCHAKTCSDQLAWTDPHEHVKNAQPRKVLQHDRKIGLPCCRPYKQHHLLVDETVRAFANDSRHDPPPVLLIIELDAS